MFVLYIVSMLVDGAFRLKRESGENPELTRSGMEERRRQGESPGTVQVEQQAVAQGISLRICASESEDLPAITSVLAPGTMEQSGTDFVSAGVLLLVRD